MYNARASMTMIRSLVQPWSSDRGDLGSETSGRGGTITGLRPADDAGRDGTFSASFGLFLRAPAGVGVSARMSWSFLMACQPMMF